MTAFEAPDRLPQVANEEPVSYVVLVGYTYCTYSGEVVSRMIKVVAKNQEQYEQFNRARLSVVPENI